MKILTHQNLPKGLQTIALSLAAGMTLFAASLAFSATFTVTNTADAGPGSLRDAISQANGNLGADVIIFNIPTTDPNFDGSVFTIKPLSGEFILTDGGTTIDGATQTSFTGDTNPNGPEVVIDGSSIYCGPFTCNGFVIPSPGNRINSLVINNFSAHGITMYGDATGNTITGCYVGTNATGTAAAGNSAYGITSPGGNTIGGTAAEEGNVISGNGFGSGSGFGGLSLGSGDIVRGNRIGTNALGTAAIPNFPFGIIANNGGGHLIEGNLISGNTDDGIVMANSATDLNVMRANKLGTDVTGVLPLGNGGDGVEICCGAGSNTIGGTSPGDGNIIAFNLGAGVLIKGIPFGSTGAVGNRVVGNAIFNNGGLGIDLGGDGVTPNDPGDADSDPDANNLQNFPVLTSAVVPAGGTITLGGTLNSTPNTSDFRIEFFANTVCNGGVNGGAQTDDHGEGETFLGFANVSTDASGDASFSVTLSANVAAGAFITATATDPSNNTSEFSQCVESVALAKPLALLAKTFLKLDHYLSVEGDLHSNGCIVYENGRPGTHNGSATAVGDIAVNRYNTISAPGDLTAGGMIRVDAAATVEGTITPGASVAALELPSLSYTCSGVSSIIAGKNRQKNVAPGDYNVLRADKNAQFDLSAGVYSVKTLQLDDRSRLRVDVSAGEVTINVCGQINFIKNADIIIVGGDSRKLTINYSGIKKVVLGSDGGYQGTLVAPNALVELGSNAGFLGSICAKSIVIYKDARVRFHGLGAIPKTAAEGEESATSDQSAVISYQLQQNYPNPFNPSTVIKFALPQAGRVQLHIYNSAGQLVRTLANDEMAQGWHELTWDGRDQNGQTVATGVYLYRLTAQDASGATTFAETRRMTFVK
ncbi:MAG: hypothetical protein DKINENOH_02518 [bacterium]|nr:hypothetical protein [bacterium]